jgi:hypothetical protein
MPTKMGTVDAIFVSEPMKIGKHEWVLFVYEVERAAYWDDDRKAITNGPQRYTGYAWRGPNTPGKVSGSSRRLFHRNSSQDWCPSESWPTYDGNDSYGGLPKRLGLLHEQNAAAVQAALIGDASLMV